jgi:DNA polymerase/3'-5' exonuclease PolX
MATRVKQAIGEIDVVAFTTAIDKVQGTGKWPAGTEGTVVSDYGDHKEVEISDNRGVALDFPVVPVEQLKLVEKHSLH